MELTKKEIELFSRIYPDSDRIRDGLLHSYQKKALQEMRAGFAYMEKKYPGYSFDYLSFNPSSRSDAKATLMFETDDVSYAVVIYSDKNNECKDTFYGHILQKTYTQSLQVLLRDILGETKTYTDFPVPMGMEIGMSTSVAQLKQMKPPVARNTHIFVKKSGYDASLADKAKDMLQRNGFYGSYLLFVTEDRDFHDMDIHLLEKTRNDLEETSFNCFG